MRERGPRLRAEVERLRELAYSLQTGGNGLPGIVFEGAVVRGAP